MHVVLLVNRKIKYISNNVKGVKTIIERVNIIGKIKTKKTDLFEGSAFLFMYVIFLFVNTAFS